MNAISYGANALHAGSSKKCRLLIISAGSRTQNVRKHLCGGHPSQRSIGQPPAAGQPQAAQ
eukprot:3743854-Lingulodinium_polyedra.AAC.1